MGKNQENPQSLTTVKVEWDMNMENVSSSNFSDGPFKQVTAKGRCKRCWGGLIGRSNEEYTVTGIRVSGVRNNFGRKRRRRRIEKNVKRNDSQLHEYAPRVVPEIQRWSIRL